MAKIWNLRYWILLSSIILAERHFYKVKIQEENDLLEPSPNVFDISYDFVEHLIKNSQGSELTINIAKTIIPRVPGLLIEDQNKALEFHPQYYCPLRTVCDSNFINKAKLGALKFFEDSATKAFQIVAKVVLNPIAQYFKDPYNKEGPPPFTDVTTFTNFLGITSWHYLVVDVFPVVDYLADKALDMQILPTVVAVDLRDYQMMYHMFQFLRIIQDSWKRVPKWKQTLLKLGYDIPV